MTPEELKTLYDKYFRTVYNFASHIVKDSDLAKDITQDVFITAYWKMDHFLFPKQYLMKITENKCKDFFRKNNIRRTKEIDELRKDIIPDHISEEYIEDSDISKMIEIVRDYLPVSCRNIFNLIFFKRMNTREVGGVLGISEQNVLNQKAKIIRVIKNKLCL